MQGAQHCFWTVAVFWAATVPAMSQDRPSTQPADPGLSRQQLADYDAEVRLPNGHVDADAMVKRLKELGVNTYYWLIWHAATDWDDLKVFLPKASRAGIDVWVYLVPPTESRSQYSEPFRMDYARWAEEIARLSLQHRNLKAWVIDDFCDNHKFFTPAYLQKIRARARPSTPAWPSCHCCTFETFGRSLWRTIGVSSTGSWWPTCKTARRSSGHGQSSTMQPRR